MEKEKAEFVDDQTLSRFELQLENGLKPKIDYTIVDDTYFLNYVKVPSEIQGRGYGDKIMKEAVEYIRSKNKKAVGICSFAATYLRRNPL